MNKIFSIFLCICLAAICLCSTSLVSANVVTYYAKIDSFSAVYDQNTETIDFKIEFSGVVFSNHRFTVSVFCSQYIDGEWVDNVEYLTCSFLYADCHTAATSFTGSVPISKADYTSCTYKGFTLRVAGGAVDTGSAIGGTYYTMDSAECVIATKAAPSGNFYILGSHATPAQCLKGGTVVLTVYPCEISSLLSGGLCEMKFTIVYDKSLLSLTKAEIEDDNSVCSHGSVDGANGVEIQINASKGITADKAVAVKLYFRTLNAGRVSFTATDISGKDIASQSFENNGYSLSATAVVEERPVTLGDVNGDGNINSIDAAIVLRYDAGVVDSVSNCDVNSDGRIDSIDAALILRYDAGVIDGFNE